MKKVNKKIIDEENGTVILIMDKETFQKYEDKLSEKALLAGFNNCLWEIRRICEDAKVLEEITVEKLKEKVEFYQSDCKYFNDCWFKDILLFTKQLMNKENKVKEENH